MKDLTETLAVMRFDVEGILTDGRTAFGDAIPSCPSQTLRAKRMIDAIDALPFRNRGPWLQRRYRLEDFCTLVAAVRVLGRETLWNES